VWRIKTLNKCSETLLYKTTAIQAKIEFDYPPIHLPSQQRVRPDACLGARLGEEPSYSQEGTSRSQKADIRYCN